MADAKDIKQEDKVVRERSSSERGTFRRSGGGSGGGGGRFRSSRDADGERGDRRGGFRKGPRSTKFYILKEGEKIEYKNLALLQKYVSDRGKILPRRYTGVSAKDQRKLVHAIKRARFLGLLSVGRAKQ